MGKRIVIMAGGTGGHVFPALAVANLLIERDWQVSWMGTQKGMESHVVPANNICIDWLPVAGLRGKGISAKIKAPFMLVRACLAALKILRARKPDVVLGMGGFVAGPGSLMAKILAIPLVIHEQNRVPGTTNRLLARFANVILEAFPGSFTEQQNAVFTGNPLRKEFSQLSNSQRHSNSSVINILVVGGSLGAQALNETVPEAVAGMSNISIKHQTGKAMLENVTEQYKNLGIKAEVTAFIDNIADAYQCADLVICRAGAMTVSELAATALPAILIPFPYAIDDHQTANAQYLADAGAGVIINQAQLTKNNLTTAINQLIQNRASMSAAAKSCAKLDATTIVADICAREANK